VDCRFPGQDAHAGCATFRDISRHRFGQELPQLYTLLHHAPAKFHLSFREITPGRNDGNRSCGHFTEFSRFGGRDPITVPISASRRLEILNPTTLPLVSLADS
jgi:hypothetical protein